MLTESEPEGLLVDWNATQTPFPSRCLHELIADQAARVPDKVAVQGEDGALTYRELDEGSSSLAHFLLASGVGADELVGICVDRTAAMMVGLLGILKTRAAYVPLDPRHPPERLRTVLDDAEVAALVTQEDLLGRLEVDHVPVVCIDRDQAEIVRLPSSAPTVEHSAEQLAYVIYTSGSTGKPKGVQIEHRSVVNLLTHMSHEPGLDKTDVVVNMTTFAFDLSVPDLYLPLVCGATLVVLPYEATLDGREIATRLEHSRATFAQATPTTWQMVLDSGWEGSSRLKVTVGGEGVPRGLANTLIERCSSVWHMYGPTETTVWSSICRLAMDEGPTPIAGPIANTRFYVLDDHLQPVPGDVPGQLFIGGAGLARGYLNRPELNAEKFIPDPFRPDTGERVYATGDLVRYREGHLEFLGRMDQQVKLRGFRIELGEIETVLAEQPSIAGAVVVVREDDPGDPQLIAYVVPRIERPKAGELRRAAEKVLPAYMVPSRVMVLDAFPVTPNGKIDRKALPAPDSQPREREQEYAAPSTPLERTLVDTWEDVLKITPIGVDDDFFDLGASSVVAARLFARMEKKLGASLELGLLFRAPTIRQLARLLGEDSGERRSTSLVVMQGEGSKPPIFCVHGGAGTILHLAPLARRLAPDQPFYGLQAQGLYGGAVPLRSVEEEAVHYIAELRDVQPRGPYYLAGYCYGAIVAYDMAQRLLRDGEEIALLAFFNGPSPAYIRGERTVHRPQPPAEITKEAKAFRALREPSRIYGRARWYALRGRWRVENVISRLCLASGLGLPEALRDTFFIQVHQRAERIYDPAPCPLEILSFYGTGLYDEPDLGWGKLAPIMPIAVPGEHPNNRVTMREPHAGFIVEHLRAYMDAGSGTPALSVAGSRAE